MKKFWVLGYLDNENKMSFDDEVKIYTIRDEAIAEMAKTVRRFSRTVVLLELNSMAQPMIDVDWIKLEVEPIVESVVTQVVV